MTKRFLILVALLAFSSTTFGQFAANRLDDLSSRLSREAQDLAETNYRSYSNSFRTNRTDMEAVMVSWQFASSAQLFSRMITDRRRNSELRDAFQFVQDAARAVERNNPQRNRWFTIQQLLSDTARELNSDYGGENQYPDTGGPALSGRMTWKGRVDDDVRIIVRAGMARTETIGGTPYPDGLTSFTASLPYRRVTVKLTTKRGRGEVFIEQQPSRENDYSAIVRIKDSKGGAADYEFELSW